MINKNTTNYNRLEAINKQYLERKRKVEKITKCNNIKDYASIKYEEDMIRKCINNVELSEYEILFLTSLNIDSKYNSENLENIKLWLEKETKRIKSNN